MTDPHVALLTREYPPDVYGGAGVHAEHLAAALHALTPVTVHCWGTARFDDGDGSRVVNHGTWDALAGDAPERAALTTRCSAIPQCAACAASTSAALSCATLAA